MLVSAENKVKKVAVLVLVLWGLWIPLLQAQEKPAIVVQPFTTANGVSWPYDMQRMTSQTLAELQTKDGKKYEISAEAPSSRTHCYFLSGEVLGWHPGNRAKRVLVGVGTGRETAKSTIGLLTRPAKRFLSMKTLSGRNSGAMSMRTPLGNSPILSPTRSLAAWRKPN